MAVDSPLQVLVIDDDADTRLSLSDVLALDDYIVETAATKAEALNRKNWPAIDAIILDRKLPDGSAEEILPRLKALAPQAAVIIATGFADLDSAIAAIRLGAADYLLKPINLDLLRNRLAGIAERKQARVTIEHLSQDVQRRMAELRTLMDIIPIGIAITEDPQCRSISGNDLFTKLLRQPPGGNISQNAPVEERPTWRVIRNGKEVPAEELPIQVAAWRGVTVQGAELDIVFPDGSAINLLANAAPLRDAQGEICGAVGAFIDITDRKRAQERLLQTERLAAIGQMMTGLAHESGNALARSQACLELLAMQMEDRPKAVELVERIQKAQDHLMHLYEEVRGYAAPLKLDRERVGLASVWRQAWGTLELARKGRNVSFREETAGIDLVCTVDSFRLQQVFRNILENALAACRDPVEIAIVCARTSWHGKPALRVAVRDNGPGLNGEQQQRIFEPFFTTKTKGTGLGMAIAKRIVEAHGGKIAVGAAPNGGAEILLILPREGA